MKRVAGDQQTAVPIPLIVNPVPVQVPLAGVRDEVRDVTVTIPLHDGAAALYSASSEAPPVVLSLSKDSGLYFIREHSPGRMTGLSTDALHQVSSLA